MSEFQELPTNEEFRLPVRWDYPVSTTRQTFIDALVPYQDRDEQNFVTAVVNLEVLFSAQGGEPLYDWMLAYTYIQPEQIEDSNAIRMSLTYSPVPAKPRAVLSDDAYYVTDLHYRVEHQSTPKIPLIEFLVETVPTDEPPRHAISDVTARNNHLLSQLEEIISREMGLDDPEATLNPLVEAFLVVLGQILDTHYTLVTDPVCDPLSKKAEIALIHNSRGLGLKITLDFDSLKKQWVKMIAEMP